MLETFRDNDSPRRKRAGQSDAADVASPFGAAEVRFSEYLRVIYRRRWLFAAVLTVVAAAILGYTWLEQPVYEARVRLVIDPEPSGPAPFAEIGGGPTPDLATVQQSLRSRELARRTVKALDLWNRREFEAETGSLVSRIRSRLGLSVAVPASGSGSKAQGAQDSSGGSAPDQAAERLVDVFLNRLRVEAVPLSRVVAVFVQAADPALAAEAANALAAQFIQQDIERRF
ncbi:MAG: Wzz/FepE/Etk N-terminal domain-containing protein, partial [Armatimonadota bacterium]|nr:Wzz/FepE/Etk N-terminal domain-containing protein [Armatimonadota bacterium]